MSKFKILVAPGDRAGSGKFRCVDPHVNLQNNFSDDFFIDIVYEIDFNNIDYLKNYDAIFIHRIPQHNHVEAIDIIKRIKNLGIKVIIDTDDHWTLDPSHGAYNIHKRNNISSTIIECIKLADLVTVPTKILANEVKKFNSNVVILPNAINPTESQFIPKVQPSDLVRVGWLGGSSHVKDIELLRDLGGKHLSISNKMQMVLCGFDTRGANMRLDQETGQYVQTPIRPEESVWFLYECFLTNNYRNFETDTDYLKYLATFSDDPSYDTSNKMYRRIWTKSISTYATSYNNIDIPLAPLNDSLFNKYKSQLKIIEAGFHKKPIIAQNFGPYTIDLINAVDTGGVYNDKGNALLVDTTKNHKLWAKYVKKLIDSPQMRIDLGEKLYETVKDKYNLNNVSELRREIYLNILTK